MDQENMNKEKMEGKRGFRPGRRHCFLPLTLLRALRIWIPVFITMIDFLGKRNRTPLDASPEPSPPVTHSDHTNHRPTTDTG